jgi:hypothetical protein
VRTVITFCVAQLVLVPPISELSSSRADLVHILRGTTEVLYSKDQCKNGSYFVVSNRLFLWLVLQLFIENTYSTYQRRGHYLEMLGHFGSALIKQQEVSLDVSHFALSRLLSFTMSSSRSVDSRATSEGDDRKHDDEGDDEGDDV